MKQATSDMTILEFDPADCVRPEDNRPAERPGRQKLTESISVHGQLVAALLCPHPDLPGKYLILDGVGRWDACLSLKKKLLAVLLPGVVPEAERIRLRLQSNVIRRNMTPDEIADDAARFMTLTGATQEQAAKELSISPASLSRAFSKQRRIDPRLHQLTAGLRPSIVAAVATLKTFDAMEKTLTFASTAGPDGRQPTREQVAGFAEQFREKKTRGPKLKLIKGEVEGRVISFSVEDDDTGETLITFFRDLANRLGKYKESPATNLGFVFAE